MKTKVVNLNKEPYDIYIGRGSKWGNPFKEGTREENIENYRNYILNSPDLLDSLQDLEGKVLGCFCKPKKCHGDILVQLIEDRKLSKIFE